MLDFKKLVNVYRFSESSNSDSFLESTYNGLFFRSLMYCFIQPAKKKLSSWNWWDVMRLYLTYNRMFFPWLANCDCVDISREPKVVDFLALPSSFLPFLCFFPLPFSSFPFCFLSCLCLPLNWWKRMFDSFSNSLISYQICILFIVGIFLFNHTWSLSSCVAIIDSKVICCGQHYVAFLF